MKRLLSLFLVVCLLLSGCMPFFAVDETKDPNATSIWADPTDPPTEPPTEPPKRIFGTVSNSVLNVRSAPGSDNELIVTLKKGDRLEILDMTYRENYLWGRIEQGWVSLSYVMLDDPDLVLLSQVGIQKGVVKVDKLKIHTGPSAQYPVPQNYVKDTRLEITGVCGKWGRTDQGWVDMTGVYIDGTEGPDDPVMCKVASNDVSLRIDPDSRAQAVRLCHKGEEIIILYQGTFGGTLWGCTEEGWICMDHVQPNLDPSIVGDWYSYDSVADDGMFFIDAYKFRGDGTYQCIDYFYHPASAEYPDGDTDSHEDEYGTFTYDGTTLIRNYTYQDWDEDSAIEEVTITTEVTVKGDTLTMKYGSSSKTLKRGDIEDATQKIKDTYYNSAIFGTWIPVNLTTDSETVMITERTYNKDGSYTVCEYEYNISSDSYRKVSTRTGPYYYHSDNLLEGEKVETGWEEYPASIQSGVLKIRENWEYISYKKGDVKSAVKAIKELLNPTPEETPTIDPAILGTWQMVSEYDVTAGEIYFGDYVTFRQDGTFTWIATEGHYFYSEEKGLEYDTTMGTGSRECRGTFSMDKGKLVLNLTYVEFSSASSWDQKTLSVSINGNKMTVDRWTYYQGTEEEIAARLFAQ